MSGIIGGAGSRSGVIGETEIDYEEGILTTPLKTGSTSQTSYSSNNSRYTRIGNICNIFYEFDTGSNANAGGVLALNAPFATDAGIRIPIVFYISSYADRYLSGGGGSTWAIWQNKYSTLESVSTSNRLIFSQVISYRIQPGN
jgi:hypothetical protein